METEAAHTTAAAAATAFVALEEVRVVLEAATDAELLLWDARHAIRMLKSPCPSEEEAANLWRQSLKQQYSQVPLPSSRIEGA